MVVRSQSTQSSIVRAKSNHRPILKQFATETFKPTPGGKLNIE